jgi:hypothetical protein
MASRKRYISAGSIVASWFAPVKMPLLVTRQPSLISRPREALDESTKARIIIKQFGDPGVDFRSPSEYSSRMREDRAPLRAITYRRRPIGIGRVTTSRVAGTIMR